MTIEWARVVFLNVDGSFTAFEVVPSLRITFAPETNPHEVRRTHENIGGLDLGSIRS
jgi:hypothetical protein